MTGVHPCCVLLHSSSVCTRGYQNNEISAKKKTKHTKKNLYFILCCFMCMLGSSCWTGMEADVPRYDMGHLWSSLPPQKCPIFSLQSANAHSIKHPHTAANSQKKSKHSGALRTEGQRSRTGKSKARYKVKGYALRFLFVKIIN